MDKHTPRFKALSDLTRQPHKTLVPRPIKGREVGKKS